MAAAQPHMKATATQRLYTAWAHAKGQRGERPHDDEEDAQATAPLLDPCLRRVRELMASAAMGTMELLGHLPVRHGRRSPRVVRVIIDERDLLRVHLWVVGVHGIGPSSSTGDLLPLH
eukprot:scaffold56838_cov67-Phaeocystis_antarctica.AAC.6